MNALLRGRLPVLLCLFLASPAAEAQRPTGDPTLDRADNPTGRAEFERQRRADPATGTIPGGIRKGELAFAATLPGAAGLQNDAKGRLPDAAAAPIQWIERGPSNQGGRTRALAIDLLDEDVFIAGGVSGGLWRSTDQGESWTRVTAIDQTHSVTTLVQDPRPGSQHVWYYGTGETRANSAGLPGDGIYRSTDRGLTWHALPATVRNTPQSRDQMFDYVHRLVIDPTVVGEDHIYAACYGGVARSTDGGTTWAEVLGDYGNGADYTDIAISSEGVLYATLSSDGGRTEGIWRSEDGLDWVEITPAGFPQRFDRIVPAIAPSREDLVYFFARTPTTEKNGHSLWVYDHNGGAGAIWEDRSSGLLYNTETYSNYCQTIKVAPYDEDVVFLGHIRMQRTTDGFRDSLNLRTQSAGEQHNDQHEIVFFPSDPTRMLAGHDGGVSYAPDNTGTFLAWEFRNRGYATTQFYSIAIDPTGSGGFPVIGGTQDNGTWMLSEEGMTEGRRIFGADGGYCAIADGGVDVYTSYQKGTIFRSHYDSNWVRTAWGRVDPEGGSSYAFIHPFTLDRADPRVMYLPEGSGLWRNSDLTEIPLSNRSVKTDINWEKLDGITPPDGGRFSALATSKANPAHRLYLGSSRGEILRVDSAIDRAPVVTTISVPNASGYINSIVVDPVDGDRVMVAFSNYNVESIFYSEDAGATWTAVSGNLEEKPGGAGNGPSVSWVAMLPVNGLTTWFAGTTTGLYSTTFLDGDETIWRQEGATSIGNVVVDMIAVRESDGFVAVGTHGRGVFTANVRQALVEAHLLLSAGTLAFDTVRVGEGRTERLVLHNRDDSERDLAGVLQLVEGPFEIVSGEGPFSIAPDDSLTVEVRFLPEANGLVGGKISIDHDGTTPSGHQTVWLVGTGVGALSVASETSATAPLRVLPSIVSERGDVRFAAESSGSYRLEIVDIRGDVVLTIDAGNLEAGERSIPFDASGIAAGKYHLRILTDEGIAAAGVVLIRR